ncbi:hypothetical protein PYW08_006427 [Mythimna loreyi]|uniref:Uncharacterized protein n=1 Tax=Mythimna loreyi TaxID=667449 RepID=A0ACC2QNL0_9NEOP|nr:hypothetical protein PYW08_006427 [Mythimna loreyi]
MWGRIYPHAALLILANVILKTSCTGNGSLTFVIDDTASMTDDIAQVKRSVDRISDIVFNEKSSQISNMVLVTFNDPEATVRTVTTNRQTFKRTLSAVHPYNINNRDCWEPSMKGLRLALETSNRDSYIYVFTDAPAKDYGDSNYVKALCQKKQSQIVFVLTGHCSNRYGAAPFDVYFDIANACSGQAFDVDRYQVEEVLRTIEETIKGNKTVFTSTVVPARVKKHIPFTIDDHTDYAIVSVSGKNVNLDITGPSFTLNRIMWNNNGKVAKLSNAKPGTYTATVMGQSRTSVVIVGRTDFFFSHGFSELKPKSLGDTSLQPIAKSNVHLSISVTDDHHTVKIVSAQILDMNENPINGPMPLTETSKDFYVTNLFAAPSNRFKVAVNGIVKATGKSIRRIGKIPITPQEPPPELPHNTKPAVEIAEGKSIEIEYNSTMKLTCKVNAYPEPKITWVNMKGRPMPSKMSIVELPYKYISYMDLSYASKGDKYKCYATNDVGRDDKTIRVDVKEPFTVKSALSGITTLTYGKEGIFTCDITSHLPIDIHWYYANEITGQTREILSSDKYEVSASRTQLKIKKMDSDLVGRYTCRVSLKNKKDVQKSFLTRVKIDGLIAPKVQVVSEVKVTKGKTAVIECKIESGVPAPKITWLFGGKLGSTFTPIGSESVLRITNVEHKHEGKYKCVAENVVSKDEHVTTLLVQDLPKITTISSVTYAATEGDAFLKIPCVAEGVPKPAIIWKLSGRTIIPNAKYSIENGALIIRGPTVSDTNSYTCEAKNEVGAYSATFKTYIRQPPKLSGVASKIATMGNPAIIECMIVKGEPKPKIRWQYMDKSSSKFVPIVGSETTLRITNADTKHAGSYKCIAQNDVGKDEHITTLIVNYLPKITTSKSIIYQATEGDASLRIPCAADGVPKPVITWKLSGRNITPNAKYSIENGALIIRGPTVSDTNSYTCEAKNEVGAYSATFKTYIRQPPKLSGVASKIATMGKPAIIECMIVKGEPKPKMSWQYMDKSSSKFVPIVGSETTLRITNADTKHAGSYKCIAQNDVGKDEHITKLIVNYLPKITTSKSIIYQATEGDASLRIPCAADGVPKPVITWKLSGRNITPNAKYSIENGALIIRGPTVSDTNSYTCEAKNEVGAYSATFKTYIRQPPKLSGVASKIATMGKPAIIECMIVKGEPKPKMSWQYMDKSSSKFVPIVGSETTLRITNADTKHAGSYKCIAQNDVGKDEHITTLIVNYLPKITTSKSIIYQATEGDASLRIPCAADGVPKPVITWKLSGRNITPNAKYSIENGALIIRGPTVSDTNSYTCEAKNEVGANSATFKTYIRQGPKVSGVATKKITIGSTASIECKVEGEPKPTITWEFMDNSSSNFLPIPGSNKVLDIPRVEMKHAGRYKCVAQNNVGKNHHITTVEVQDLPKIVSSDSTTYESIEGDALLKVPCVAAGLPKPTITWKLNGRVIDPSEKYSIQDGALIIRDPKVSDTNSYTCEAKNEAGTVSATFKTYIRQLPKISGVASKNVIMGDPTSIDCTIVKGEPKPKMSWQYMDKSSSKFVPIVGSETTLRFTKTEKKHAGSYKCVAQNSVGSVEHITTLIVEYAPGIITNSSTVEGIVGDLALRIPCDVFGVPKPVIIWKLKGITITPDEKYSIEDGALIIRKPTEKDTSSYTCEAKNHVSTVSTTFQANVDKYPKSSGTVHYIYLKQGETRKLKCDAYNSTSQSVKWFLTRELPDLSTTSARPETSTVWSKESSTKMRKITQDAGNNEHIQIASASAFDHDGNYTCHVSDKHGNTQTHTYVVDVGIAPKFLNDDNTLSNWRGDVKDIMSYCKTDENTKPKPLVEWKFNGKVLTDLSLAGVGHYTCNASNAHGSVLKEFDVKSSVCLLTRTLRDSSNMPLILNDEGSWIKFETTNYYTIVGQEVKIILSCPSQKEMTNKFKKFPEKNTLEAICYKEDVFMVDDKFYKLSDLQCTNSIEPSVIKKKTKCSTETSELMSVGYNVPAFLEAYEVCFDHKSNMPSYTRIVMTETNDNGANGGYNWYTYPGIGSDKTERGFTCKDASSSCCYSKSQLVNAIDFNDGPAKKSTFIDPLNVVPVWIPCDTSKLSWEDINDMVRSQLSIYTDIVVWSGTHTLQQKNGAVIPRYLWKVVRLAYDEVMAIVHVNDPNPTKSDIKCNTPDHCDKYEDWFKSDDSTYCCSLPDFLKSFDIHSTDIGEYVDAALDGAMEPIEF